VFLPVIRERSKRMQARVREMWEGVKAAGVDLLTEGIRLVQVAGEQLLQQIADRRLHVPAVVRDALERIVGRAAAAPPEEVEFVCEPAGSDRFVCEPAAAPPVPAADAGEAVPKAVRRRTAGKRAGRAESAAPKRPRRRKPKPSVPPAADGIDAS